MARFLSTALVHSSEVAPRRHVGSHAAGAAAADYGLLRGVFSPVELLRRPQLHRYAAYLEAHGAQPPSGAPAGESAAERVEEIEGLGGAEAETQEAEEAGEGEAAEEAEEVEVVEEAEEAGEAEEAEEVAVLSRLQGEVALEGAACELLQRALAVAARHGHAALAACAIGMGAAVRAR